MEHKNTFTEHEILPNRFIRQISTIPSVLKKYKDVAEIVTNGNISIDDVVQDWPEQKAMIVTEIIEQRKARGDWSGKSYDGLNPVWSKIKYTRREADQQ